MGHLFLVNGDLTRLACDAWLLPTDRQLTVEAAWKQSHLPGVAVALDRLRVGQGPTEEWRSESQRVQVLHVGDEVASRPFLVNTAESKSHKVHTDDGWLMEGAIDFLDTAYQWLKTSRPGPLNRRETHLLALPFVGTGAGGAGRFPGEVIERMVSGLQDFTSGEPFDVALVTRDRRTFVAAQASRRRLPPRESWPELGEDLLAEASRIASDAREGNLVLFLGGGTSIGAGLPDWKGLLRELAKKAALSDEEIGALGALPQIDQARIIEDRLAAMEVNLGEAIRDLLEGHHHSLIHALLAGLPITEAVTMNYDCQFEQASEGAGIPMRILPEAPGEKSRRWFLKLHGSVTEPGEIVLTRDDYLNYAARRSALMGIVQALLLTRKMLFVGFSLSDDHFHAIVHDVKKALGNNPVRGDGDPLGKALSLRPAGIVDELWSRQVTPIPMCGPESGSSEAARVMEIFLDFVSHEATTSSDFLLDPAFEAMLTDSERDLKMVLNEILSSASGPGRDAPAWTQVVRLIRDLGGEPPSG